MAAAMGSFIILALVDELGAVQNLLVACYWAVRFQIPG